MEQRIDTLGGRLIEARVAAGLSVSQAAKLLDLPPSYIRSVEAGEVNPATSVVDDFGRCYDVQTAWLQSGVERDVTIPPGNMTEKDRESLRRLFARSRQDE